ncbi:transmembrane channel-like protein [Topomyia yanbarensis]|uniref:transmembrane channel-like protein n=1 Tax=Topomyia yanbarensis TaxID=2498891 RepID=UPI00273AFA5C|nr:transmembrane channel-like protein [Topomyia yanbarensis]
MSDSEHGRTKRKHPGILKLDPLRTRRLSGSSTGFEPSTIVEDVLSPSSTVSPQLSVTWAFQLNSNNDCDETDARIEISDDRTFEDNNLGIMKTTDSNTSRTNSNSEMQQLDDEDYSASIDAIFKRKASVKKKRGSRGHRRTSSLVNPIMGSVRAERRRSSAYTTSSGETAVTLEEAKDDSTQDKIFENIRLHKEVLQSVKLEPWSMKRKLKLVKQAKSYVSKHEGALQEHFTSRTAKSLLTQFHIFLATKWRQILREITNLSTYLVPWESRIKEIESHFGSVVASYFTFLRWLFWVNIVISLLLVVFVMVPEEIYVDSEKVKCDMRKTMSRQEQEISSNFSTIWEFEGRLKYSALFYGYYSTFSGAIAWGYNLPLAYFLTGLVVYIYSFVATLKKMAKNSRMSKLSSKDDDYVFSWKLFTGWDYMIGHTETSQNRMASIILGFKEALLEEAEKKKDTRNWRIILLRLAVNFVIVALLAVSAFAVVHVVKRSMDIKETDSWWTRNEITVVMSLITFFFPMFFEALGLLEYYHPRKQLRIQLARIMVLNLLNLYSLIFALFDKINHMTEELRKMKPNFSYDSQCFISNMNYSDVSSVILDKPSFQPLFQTSISDLTSNCYRIVVDCAKHSTLSTAVVTTMFLSNYTSVPVMPEFVVPTSIYVNVDETTLSYSSSELSLTTDYRTSTIYPALEATQTEIVDEYDFNYDEEDAAYYLEQRMRNLPNDQFDGIPINKREVNNTFDYLNDTTTNAIETNSVAKLVETTLYDTEYDLETSFDEKQPYISEKYDELLGLYNNSGDDIVENSKCFQWICHNETKSSTEFVLFYSEDESTEASTMPHTIHSITDKPTHSWQPSNMDKAHSSAHEERKFKNADIRTLCWETMFGQELAKLTIMDLIVTILSTMILDFLRALFVRYMNNCWCWDLEKTYPQYGDFKIAENILHLVNNQGMVWMGMFFSPGLAVLNIFKLVIIMYLRSWTVLTCNVPHEVVFRASRSNNFYFALLLTMLFLCVLPVSYAIVFLEPSWHCGPFSQSNRIYHLLTNATDKIVPDIITNYIVSPAAVIPLLVLLILIIYYLISLTGSLREANQDLKIQLRKERTEERRKMFKIATKQHCQQNESVNGLSSSWHKVLNSAQLNTYSQVNEFKTCENSDNKHRELLQKMMKKALRKEQNQETEDVIQTVCDDNTLTMLKSNSVSNTSNTKKKNLECASGKKYNSGKSNHIDNKSNTSTWVDNIPVITISKTSSDECIIDSDVEDPHDTNVVS